MNNEKRLKFECWNCKEEYTQLVKGYVQIIVECPYCEHEAVVDLTPPSRSSVTTIHKGGAQPNAPLDIETLKLPDVLPTRPKE